MYRGLKTRGCIGVAAARLGEVGFWAGVFRGLTHHGYIMSSLARLRQGIGARPGKGGRNRFRPSRATLTPCQRADDNSDMDDKPRKRGGGAVVVMALVAVLVFLPTIYVLSTGPAIWWCNNVEPSWAPTIETTYQPLNWVVNHVPVIGQVIVSYVEWWRPDYGPGPAPDPP